MKKLFLSTMLLGAFAMPAQAELLALYQFDNSGDLGLDSSGKHNNATNYGASFSASGNQGGAAVFNGTSDYLRSPVNVDQNATPSMTWGAWVKPTETNAVRAVLSSDNCCYDRDIDIDSRGGSLSWSAFTGDGVVGSGVAPSTINWTFLAVSYDQAAHTLALYVNGNAAVISSTNFDTPNNSFFDIAHNPSYGEYFSGYIDNVFVYDQALTAAQIASVRNGIFSVDEPSSLLLWAAAGYGWMMRKRGNTAML